MTNPLYAQVNKDYRLSMKSTANRSIDQNDKPLHLCKIERIKKTYEVLHDLLS